MSVEQLCGGCGHSVMSGHLGRKSAHNLPDGGVCGCPTGIRSDVFANIQLSQMVVLLRAVNDNLFKLLQAVQIATGKEITVERDPKTGDINVSARPLQGMSGIIAP
jgi:hypothetical protein